MNNSPSGVVVSWFRSVESKLWNWNDVAGSFQDISYTIWQMCSLFSCKTTDEMSSIWLSDVCCNVVVMPARCLWGDIVNMTVRCIWGDADNMTVTCIWWDVVIADLNIGIVNKIALINWLILLFWMCAVFCNSCRSLTQRIQEAQANVYAYYLRMDIVTLNK